MMLRKTVKTGKSGISSIQDERDEPKMSEEIDSPFNELIRNPGFDHIPVFTLSWDHDGKLPGLDAG